MSELLLPGNQINSNVGVHDINASVGKIRDIIAVCDVTTTAATVFDLKVRSGQADRSDTVVGGLPVGAEIFHLSIVVPSGLVATNGDRLKLATAVGATGTQTFNATGSTAYVASAVAASTTFAAAGYRFEISPFSQAAAASQSAALSGAVTFKLYNDNGTTGAGAGISVASGTAQIICRIKAWLPTDYLPLAGINGRPARA